MYICTIDINNSNDKKWTQLYDCFSFVYTIICIDLSFRYIIVEK